MPFHICKPLDYCICSSSALEPEDYCPIHGGCLKTYPPQCIVCGRFLKIKYEFSEENFKSS